MFDLAYNANGLRNLPLETAIKEVADAGFDGIELSLHPNHLDPFAFTESDAERLRTVLETTGLTACCLATGADDLLGTEPFEPSLIHPDPDGRRARIDLITRSIRIARRLGVPVINFASGRRKPEVAPDQAARWLRDGVRRLLEEAAGEVVLAMEPEPGFFLQTNAQVAELHADLAADGFALCQDLGHCRVVEDDYLGSVERHLPITRHIQVEDIKGRVHRHEIPGDGDIDFPAFFAALRRGGYTGYLSVELYNHADVYREALRRSHDHLRTAESAAA